MSAPSCSSAWTSGEPAAEPCLQATHRQASRGALRMACACVQCGGVRNRPGLSLKGAFNVEGSFLEVQHIRMRAGLQPCWVVYCCAHAGRSACTGMHCLLQQWAMLRRWPGFHSRRQHPSRP